MAAELPRPKVWRYPKVVSEHAFDKLQLLDCTFGEFEAAIVDAEVIEDRALDDEGSLKELLLSVAWRPAARGGGRRRASPRGADRRGLWARSEPLVDGLP